MFDQLFFRSDASTRWLSASLVDDRRQCLAQCAVHGMSKWALRMKVRSERPNDAISLPEMKKPQGDGRVATGLRRKARRPSGCGIFDGTGQSTASAPGRNSWSVGTFRAAKEWTRSFSASAALVCFRQIYASQDVGSIRFVASAETAHQAA